MSPPFPEHPLRNVITAELHARTFEPLHAPARVAHVAYLSGERGSGVNARHLLRLLEHFGIPKPPNLGQQFFVDVGGLRLRWERHTEFVTYSFSREGAYEHPFTDALLSEIPADWLQELPGQVVAAALLALESRDAPEHDLTELTAIFDDNAVIGATVAGGAGIAWSDLRNHPDGFGRILVRDVDLSAGQAGRLVKRILDVNAYRAMSLLGLPLAREAAAPLTDAENRLADVARRMTAGNNQLPAAQSTDTPPPERALLAELTALASEIEAVAAQTASRFDASHAYYQVVRQRLEQLRQQRIQGLQTVTEFLEARLAPGVATCEATGRRQQNLAERAARMTALLRARVELQLQEQNRSLLDSMDRRAKLQLRLQETVEGLSVVAVGYYGGGLVGSLLKGLSAAGWPIDPTLGVAIALPLVVGAAWFGLTRTKRRLLRETEPVD
ncbi:MAG: DUF3422 domain-containing protein [Thiohalocapsa sp.]